MGGVYEHVTPETKQRILDVLTSRWEASLLALRVQEQERHRAAADHGANDHPAGREPGGRGGAGAKMIAQISPEHG
jgi:hypothetical protein